MNWKLQLVTGLMITSICMVAMANSPQASPPTSIQSSPGQANQSAAPPALQTALEQAKAESRQADARNKIICKHLQLTGSRMGRKVCHSQAEWTAMEGGADTFLRDMQCKGGMRPLHLDELGRTKGIAPEASSAFDPP